MVVADIEKIHATVTDQFDNFFRNSSANSKVMSSAVTYDILEGIKIEISFKQHIYLP